TSRSPRAPRSWPSATPWARPYRVFWPIDRRPFAAAHEPMEQTMAFDEQEDARMYNVVVNDEEQYSIWFADRQPPLGWHTVGKTGTKQECLDYIKEVWTDMRPLSLRKKMDAAV